MGIEITDTASGESVSHGNFSGNINDTKMTGYSLDRPLDDQMTFTAHLIIGQRTITVPIDLKEVPLP